MVRVFPCVVVSGYCCPPPSCFVWVSYIGAWLLRGLQVLVCRSGGAYRDLRVPEPNGSHGSGFSRPDPSPPAAEAHPPSLGLVQLFSAWSSTGFQSHLPPFPLCPRGFVGCLVFSLAVLAGGVETGVCPVPCPLGVLPLCLGTLTMPRGGTAAAKVSVRFRICVSF